MKPILYYAFFLEGKKLYYINTGGEYMRGGEKEIKLLMMEQVTAFIN